MSLCVHVRLVCNMVLALDEAWGGHRVGGVDQALDSGVYFVCRTYVHSFVLHCLVYVLLDALCLFCMAIESDHR